jgi:hypothetical protein
MNNQTEKICEALNSLCDVLDLGRSESSTERLFFILARAFDDLNVQEMETVRQISHDEGLCYDMCGSMADKILAAREYNANFSGLSR